MSDQTEAPNFVERRADVRRMFSDTSTPVPEKVKSDARQAAARMFGLDAPNAMGPLAVGDILGPYRIKKLLGAGGQGYVYEGAHTHLDRAAAIKVPRQAVAERLLKEARITARLDHPHIVRVEDVGEHEDATGSVPYLVMELLTGGSLDHLLESHPEGLPLDAVRRIGGAVLEALAYAHDQGVVHRDVKPSNVLFDGNGEAKLSDLGIGTLSTHAGDLDHSVDMSQLTGDGAIGTPLYMAPEQENPGLLHGGTIDGRADLFSFGKMLFLMLTGATPRTIRPASRMRDGLAEAWDELIFKLVEEDRENRPANAAAVLAVLRALPGEAGSVRVRVKPSDTFEPGGIFVQEKVPVGMLVFNEKVPVALLVPPGSQRAAWLFGLLALVSFASAGFFGFLSTHVHGHHGSELVALTIGSSLAAFFLWRSRKGELRAKQSIGLFGAFVFGSLLAGWSPALFLGRASGAFDLLHGGFMKLTVLGDLGTVMLGTILLAVFRARRRPPGPPLAATPVVRAKPRGPGGAVLRVIGVITGLVTLAGSVFLAGLAFLTVVAGVALNAVAERHGWEVALDLGPVTTVGTAVAVAGVAFGLLVTIPLVVSLMRGRRA